MTSLWHQAAAFSARAHEHQYRKDGRTPYACHPARVALIVATMFGVDDERVLAAAFLHDVIEDGAADYDEVEETFGREVADLVAVLSKDKRLPEPERERAYDEALAAGPPFGRLLKLADVCDNLADAATTQVRRAMMARAERALHLARDDDDAALAVARDVVRRLLEETEADLAGRSEA